MSSWHAYPKVYNLGHPAIADLFRDPVHVEEKVDGSQFSWTVTVDGTLQCKGSGPPIVVEAPNDPFKLAVRWCIDNQSVFHPGWTYRGEVLNKPKHNILVYERIPKNNIILFDINTEEETYLPYYMKVIEADRIGLEVVPALNNALPLHINSPEDLKALLDTPSILGGAIEGVVIKNYNRFGPDKKVLMGKYVSPEFKETHKTAWRNMNPTQQDVLMRITTALKTEPRWMKAVQHLRESGKLEDHPKDIGLLIKEVPADILKEEMDFIKDTLFQWAWPNIQRGVVAGLPDWYKARLVDKQFANKEGSI